MVKKKRTLLDAVRENEPNPDSYAVIAAKGNDVVYMFEGDYDILLELISRLKDHVQAKIECNKLH